MKSDMYPKGFSEVEARKILAIAQSFQRFLLANREVLLKEYGAGKFVAVVNEKVVAVADSADEAYEAARRRYPEDFILTASTDGSGDLLVPCL